MLAFLVAASSLVLAQASVSFSFLHGFQTASMSDLYYLTVTAQTDKGSTDTLTSFNLPFDMKYDFTFLNADKYITNIKASFYRVGSTLPLAHFTSDSGVKLFNYNFFLIASTKSYDKETKENVPAVHMMVGSADTGAITIMAADFFRSPQGPGRYTPPTSYPVYFSNGTLFTTVYPTDSSIADGSAVQYTTRSNEALLLKGPLAEHEFCYGGVCALKNSTSYATSGQLFAAVYYGNADLSLGGKVNFIMPPAW